MPSYTAQWSRDLEVDLEVMDWDNICVTTKSSSQNILALETNDKVLMRWYLVPLRISNFLPWYPPVCFHACGQEGTHAHIWSTCPVVQQFWTDIFRMASTLMSTMLDLDPCLALLNHNTLDYTRAPFCLILQVMIAAKQTIA